MPIGDYIKRADRVQETAVILEKPALNFLQQVSAVGGFSPWSSLPAGWETTGRLGNGGYDSTAYYTFRYADTSSNHFLGFWSQKSPPLDLSQYDLISVTMRGNPELGYSPDFQMELKDFNFHRYVALYTLSAPDIPTTGYKTYTIPLEGREGMISEVNFKLVLETQGVGKQGTVYFQDISFLDLKKYTDKQWQNEAHITAGELQAIKVEARNLTAVGASIGSDKPLNFKELIPWLDAPSFMHYSPNAKNENELASFKRVDGSEVTLSGSNVSRLVLADGTVNEYETTGNQATSEIHGQDAAVQDGGSLEYGYGVLRKITQQDGRVYNLEYEFDSADGGEITVIRDELTGDERRFKNGELLRSDTEDELETRYSYQNGVLRGAEVFYKNRVLNSTQYAFSNNETLITDEEGTTWFYDKDGNLTKHLTQDGYLFGYSDFTISTENRQQFVGAFGEDDYKTKILGASGLQSVSLLGYEAPDGAQVIYGSGGLVEIRFLTGDQAVNVVLDEKRRIRSGQIQFKDGLIVEIENYLPVRGRDADGEIFNAAFPPAQKVELLIGEDGSYQGVRLDVNGRFYFYDPYGRLIKVESEDGERYTFVYNLGDSDVEMGYTQTYRKQVDFNGVPYPRELQFEAGDTLKLSSPEMILGEVPLQGDQRKGFIAAVFVEATNQWKVISGKMGSDGDRVLLRQFLESLKAGQSVAIAISDPDFSRISEEILVLLEGAGAGNVRAAAASQSNWFFFGNETLEKGQGREKTGGNSFLTYDETVETHSLSGIAHPVFEGKPMLAGIPKDFGDFYADFMKRYEKVRPDGEIQAQTVYDPDNRIVFTQRVDGIFSFYEHGKVRETYNHDRELIYTHEYLCLKENQSECKDDDFLLSKITLVKARSDFEREQAKLREQIAQVRYDALYDLAQQHEVADAAVRQGVREGQESLDEVIRQLEAQRFVTVRQCHRTWCGQECSDVTFENPKVVAMINEYQANKRDLVEKILPEQIASIPSVIEEKRLEIEISIRDRLADLDSQAADVLHEILKNEFSPVLTDLYRRILGRDPSTEEINNTVTRFQSTGKIDLRLLQQELVDSQEKQQREADKAAIITGVRTFLESYLASLADTQDANNNQVPDAQEALLTSLGLLKSEVVSLTREEVTQILTWLESRDLHFGQSAFLSLQTMLLSRNINVPMVTIGVETVLIDIFAGVINRFTEGDLLISVFALDRTAKIHGAEITGARYTEADLINLFQTTCPNVSAENPCRLRVMAHLGGDHFAVISSIEGDKITYIETIKGQSGESQTVQKDQFFEMWDTGNGTGHLVVFEDQVIAEKKIDDQAAMRIRGAFFPLIWLFWIAVAALVFTAASIVVSFISPTLGKILGYIAMVLSIISIVGSIANFVVEGAKMALTQLSNGVFSAIRNGFVAVGKVLFSAVKAAGQFIQSGFTFLKDVAAQGLRALGSGIRAIGSFIKEGIKLAINPGTGMVKESLSFGQQIGRSLIAAGINMGVSKGLEGLGVDPRLARLSGAFISGGIVGLGMEGTSFLQSGVQQYLIQGVSEIGLHLDLPPPLTAALSIAATASLQTYFNPDLTFKTIVTELAPSFAAKLTMGGIELLGRSMGLDPRITQLISMPIGMVVGGLTQNLLNPGTGGIFNAIKDSLLSRESLGRIVSTVAYLAADKWGTVPVLIALSGGKLLTSVIGGFLSKGDQGFFGSIVSGIVGGANDLVHNFVSNAIENAPELTASVMNGESLGDVFERLVVGALARSTLEDVVGIYGSIKTAYEQGKRQSRIVTLRPGIDVREIQMGTAEEPMTVWESLDGTKTLRVESKDRIVEGEGIRIIGQNFVLTSGTVTYKNPGTGVLIHEVYENNQLLQRQIVGDNQFVDMYGNGRTSSGAANPLKFDQSGNILEGTVENLVSGERVIYSAQTIRVEKSDKRLFSQGSNGLNYWFSYGGGNVQFEEYSRATGQLISKGDSATKMAPNNTVFVTQSGQMPGVTTQSIQSSPGTTTQADYYSSSDMTKAFELFQEQFGTQFDLANASGIQMDQSYRQQIMDPLLDASTSAEFDQAVNSYLGVTDKATIDKAKTAGSKEYGSSFKIGKKINLLKGEFDFSIAGGETRKGKFEFGLEDQASRYNLLWGYAGIKVEATVNAGGTIVEDAFTRTQTSVGVSTTVELDSPVPMLSGAVMGGGMVGVGSELISKFFRDTAGNTIAQKTGVEFVESKLFMKGEGVLGKVGAFFQGSLAQGISTTFNLPNPDTNVGGKLASFKTEIFRENGENKAKITILTPMAGNYSIVKSRLAVEVSISSKDSGSREKRENFIESFTNQLDGIMSQVGGGTLIPGAGGVLGAGSIHQISEVVASQLFEVDQMQQQGGTIDSLIAGKDDLVGKLDPAFLDVLLKQNTNGIRIISF
ncbi:MAG: hypothetical protein A2351_06190 [Omnitrophica bacterium RIFOXYB12_FULL_50_7]|nr:MAG: hypothetical protein A2351_06190 [Omnitrophica bacterium RIFOXYB12_FULL_50_7]